MFLKLILSGRIGKWAYPLVEYDLAYEPLRSMKGQVVAYFIIDHAVDMDHPVNFVQLKPWGLYFVVKGREPGVWLFSLVACV
jgi:hypothetical protein